MARRTSSSSVARTLSSLAPAAATGETPASPGTRRTISSRPVPSAASRSSTCPRSPPMHPTKRATIDESTPTIPSSVRSAIAASAACSSIAGSPVPMMRSAALTPRLTASSSGRTTALNRSDGVARGSKTRSKAKASPCPSPGEMSSTTVSCTKRRCPS
ncbi:hypothetical protein T492DRAFT_1018136 [Pavlovales sp. CCMP2436]|nr:hypothetical protein T492DRAFT_1018136 [Pavlovales sp. CCMP2436]